MRHQTLLRSLFVALAAVLLGAPGVLAQTGEDIIRFGQREPGSSPRMAGLGGAGVGGVADWGAAVVNPAALALVGGSHVTGSLDAFSVFSEPDLGLDARVNQVGFGHAAYVYRAPTLRGSLVFGVGYNRLASLDRRLFAGEAPRTDFYESGYVGEFSGVTALEVAPGVYFGGSANLVFGYYDFASFGGEDLAFDTRTRGFNVRGGVIAEAVPGLRLGASVESPSWLYAEEFFGPGSFGEEYTLQTPWRFAVGGAFQQHGLLVSADIEYADWSQARLRPSTAFTEANRDIRTLYRETIDARLGVEYDFGDGAVRGGFALRQDPLRDEVETSRLRSTVSAGLSYYAARGITFDFGVSFTEFDDQIFAPGLTQPVVETVGSLRGVFGIQVNL